MSFSFATLARRVSGYSNVNYILTTCSRHTAGVHERT